jgi:hypothetical protein
MAEETAEGRLRLAYSLLYGRAPSAEETQMGLGFLKQSRLSMPGMAAEEQTRSAWTGLMRVLFSANEFFYVD